MSERDDVAAWATFYAPEPLKSKIFSVLAELEAEKTRGIDRATYEMVVNERDEMEARLAAVPALVEALRFYAEGEETNPEQWDSTKAREALAAWEKT